jgi:hypothetical protein
MPAPAGAPVPIISRHFTGRSHVGGHAAARLGPAGGVEPIVHEVVEAFRYPLAQQGFKVDVEIAPDLPDVPIDALAMKQALACSTRSGAMISSRRPGRWTRIS